MMTYIIVEGLRDAARDVLILLTFICVFEIMRKVGRR